jgi:hypothetical protein
MTPSKSQRHTSNGPRSRMKPMRVSSEDSRLKAWPWLP